MLRERGIAVHTLVNNAGFGLRGYFEGLPHEKQLAMIDLNVTALTSLCRLMLPGMIERRQGGILNVASLAAFQAGPYMAVYYATKAFVLSLSEALHDEAKPHGVTVTALCPGPTESEFSDTAGLKDSRLFEAGVMSLGGSRPRRSRGLRGGPGHRHPGSQEPGRSPRLEVRATLRLPQDRGAPPGNEVTGRPEAAIEAP